MTNAEAERRAQQLAEHFQAYDETSLRLFLKCVYRLPEAKIQLLLEAAAKAEKNPEYYFKAAAKKEMDK